ncbi:hypothetical protein EYF80_034052 [Liparis tanakae]|uniref:Uncharacterized protein n=1 Tax=Liparis tanakae TaxID=230148 RepID=A0A4Z2GSQ5_9TELE|nr:hypothetical protein EYF80_034052 [Liparis tanakae]
MSRFPQPQVTEVILHRSKLMATLWVTSGSDGVAGSVTVPLRGNSKPTSIKKSQIARYPEGVVEEQKDFVSADYNAGQHGSDAEEPWTIKCNGTQESVRYERLENTVF